MTHTCRRCGRAATDTAPLCHTCTTALRLTLEQLPDLIAELDTTRLRQAKIAAEGRSTGTPLPWNEHASNAQFRLITITARAAHTYAKETDELISVVPWHYLHERLASIRNREWAPTLADDLTRATRDAWQAIDRPAQRYYAGPCGADIQHPDGLLTCGYILWVDITQTTTTCRACHTTWDVLARREWLMASARDILESATVIASAITLMTRHRCTASTIRTWKARGLLTAQGEDHGRVLYRVGDVLDLVARNETREDVPA